MYYYLEHFLNSNSFIIQTASSLSKCYSQTKRQSLVKINNIFPTIYIFHVFAVIFICSFMPVRVACIDYDVQTMPISKQKQSTVNYYVNYYQDKFNMDQSVIQNSHWFSLKQDVVRIKLGKLSPENRIVNVYKGEITQILEEESFKGSQSANQMCDIVKVINSQQGFNKYLVNHHLDKTQNQSQNREQYFLSTAHMSSIEITKYNQSMIQQMNNLFIGSDGPLLRLYQQKRQAITLYSVTNELNIHQISVLIKSGDFYKHSPQRSESPSMMILEDQRLLSSNKTTTIYSPNLSEISFEVEHCSKVSQSLLNKYKPDNHKYIELFQIEDNLVMKCISEQVESDGTTRVNIGLFIVELSQNVQGHSWKIKKQSNVDINAEVPSQNILYKDSIYDSIQVKVLQSSNKEQKDVIYIKTMNKLFKVQMEDKKLQLRELTPIIKNITKLHFVTMIPIRVKNAPKEHNYLWLVQKNNGLLLARYQNTIANQINMSIQLTQNFNNTLSVEHIQSLSYAPYSNIKIPFGLNQSKNNGFAVLQVIVLTGLNKNKQFIIQIFHETRSLEKDKLAHLLHVNKIYHNYNVNTNKGYYFSDRFNDPETLQQQKIKEEQEQEEEESQFSFINKIERVIFPRTQSNITNNLGIIQTQFKITYFQYGVPRTISPQVSVSTQNLKQDNYGNIADASYIYTDGRNIKVTETKSLSQSEVQQKIIQYNFNQKQLSSYIIRNPIQDDELQRIVLTLDRYLVVIQVNPRALYHYEYVCNLNSIGSVNEKHQILNDVTIDLSEICGNSDDIHQESEQLVYCEERQTIKFVINYQTIQQQKDYFMHTLLLVIFIVLFITNLIVVVVFWKKIKEEAQKLLEIRKRKKQKTVFSLSNSGKEEPKNMIQE